MSATAVVGIFKGINLAIELFSAGSLVMTQLSELQQRRAAEGTEVTEADVNSLMARGDVQAALERARLAVAKAAQDAS